MKKKLISILLAVVACALIACVFTACGDGGYPEHEHIYGENGKCTVCNDKISVGLNYKLNDDDTYMVCGPGTCKDKNIKIPPTYNGKSVTEIRNWAFSGYGNLTSVTIPDSVTTVGEGAFSESSRLKSVTIGNGVTKIDQGAFYKCTSLTSVIIPDSVTEMGYALFGFCTGLKSVTIGNGVTMIDSTTFCGCSRLTNVTIGKSVTTINGWAFYDCSRLTSINFKGTKAQWKAINKDSVWDDGTGKYTVHCTDGNIAK